LILTDASSDFQTFRGCARWFGVVPDQFAGKDLTVRGRGSRVSTAKVSQDNFRSERVVDLGFGEAADLGRGFADG
jgi:hypothetical protein